jgi:hypothetical protein
VTSWTEVEVLRVALLAALAVIATLALALWRSSGWVGRANRRRNEVARAGESDAERVLARLGWEVVARQVSRTWELEVDGEPQEVRSRADLLVRRGRGRRRYVVEVKTGDRAPTPTLPATRRQLLEYALVFDVEGVLLLDMDRREVHVVRFPGLDQLRLPYRD